MLITLTIVRLVTFSDFHISDFFDFFAPKGSLFATALFYEIEEPQSIIGFRISWQSLSPVGLNWRDVPCMSTTQRRGQR